MARREPIELARIVLNIELGDFVSAFTLTASQDEKSVRSFALSRNVRRGQHFCA
jgi:hypothetical protein